MRLAVFDTNVLVSAGIRRDSAPAQLVSDWVLEGLVKAVTSPSVVQEYREVVRRPKFTPYGFPPMWLETLIDESLSLPEPSTAWPVSVPDIADLNFLALAHASGAWLITGNLRHFPENARNGVTVMTPSDYLQHLQSI